MREDPLARSYDNPSAARFDPSVPAVSEPEPWNGTRIVLVLVVLAVSFAEYWLSSFRGRGWLSAAAAVAALGIGVAHHALARKQAAERNEDFPYTRPNHITR